MTIDTWGTQTRDTVQMVWDRIVSFTPNVVGAFIIALVGAIVGYILGWVVTKLFQAIKLQTLADQSKLTDVLKRAKLRTDIAEISGDFVKWVVILAFLIPAAQVLQVTGVSDFFEGVLSYVPIVIGVAVFLVFALQVIDVIAKLTRTAAEGLGFTMAKLAEMVVRWAFYIGVATTAMFALGVPREFTVIIFIGVVSALALGIGLAAGLGGRDHMDDLVKRLRSELKK